MACPDENQIVEYFQRVLADDLAAEVEEHLDACPECRALVADLARDELLEAGHDQPPGLAPSTMVEHFRVARLIGRGGMGLVYLAHDTRLGRKVALKVIRPEQLGSPDALARFVAEAKTLARFNHPHIVTVYSVGEHLGQPYLAMEYLSGDTLQQRLGREPLGLRQAVRSAIAIAHGLDEAHRHGVLHRDLKPANVMFSSDGRLRVVDFSLAKRTRHAPPPGHELQETALASRGALDPGRDSRPSICGTPAYMAPEQWLGETVTAACDVWALGVMLFEMLAGCRPWADIEQSTLSLRQRVIDPRAAPSPEVHVGSLPREVVEVIAACLDKAPDGRPTAAQVADALARWLQAAAPSSASASEDAPCPFRGLLPFAEQHASLFFGRDAEVASLVEHLREAATVAVIGPSGVGKSSFVRAGLIPRLREQGRWQVLRLRPGADPFARLARAWSAGSSSARRTGDASAQRPGSNAGPRPDRLDAVALRRSPELLGLRLLERAEEEGCRVLLFVDQLEELFTLADEATRSAFLTAVCSAADDPDDPVRVVLALRDDFIVPLSGNATARRALRQIVVLHSPETERLREVLVCPLEQVGFSYDDPTLVDQMIAEVAHAPAGLPLVQFALQLLWERRDATARQLRRATFDAIGGVGGALALHADGVLDGFSPAEVELSRQLLLRLVTREGTRAVVAESDLLDGLDAEAAAVLARLTESRLLSVRRGEGQREVELAHESLVASWHRLASWVEQSRDDIRFLDEVNRAAELWETRGARDDELWSGSALRDALEAARRLPPSLPARVARFLRRAEQREQRRVRRGKLRAALVFGGLALLALASSITALSFAEQKRGAEQKRREAEAKHAIALRESARAALARRSLLQARGRLRASLEIEDSLLGRALHWRLVHDPLRFRRRIGAKAHDVAFSADGQRFAVASQDQSVYLFDRRTLAVRVLRGHDDQVFAVAFAPDGRLASGDWGGTLRLWDLERDTVKLLRGHRAAIWRLRFSADGQRLASSSWDGTLRVWPVKRGADTAGAARVLEGHRGRVYGLDFAPDGHSLASSGDDGTVRLWHVRTGVERRRWTGHDGRVYDVAFGQRGRLLASAGADRTVRLWHVDSGDPRVAGSGDPRVAGSATSVPAASPTGSAGDRVTVLRGHGAGVYAVAFSPDGRRLAAGSWDGAVRVWPLADPASESAGSAPVTLPDDPVVLREHGAGIYAVAFSPDGELLVSGGADDAVCGWRATAPRAPRTAAGHRGQVWAVAFSPDGRQLASSGRDQTVRLWDVGSGRQLTVLQGHDALVTALVFSPDNRQLASAGADKTVRIWDLGTPGRHRRLIALDAATYGLAYRPDGRWLAIGSSDGAIHLVEAASGRLVRRLDGHRAGVWDVAFSPDGRRLASSSADHSVRLWNVASGKIERTLPHDGTTVFGVAFHPGGGQVATSSGDGEVRLWDLGSGEPRQLGRVDARSYFLAFSPDGERVGVPGSDGTGRIWPVAGGPPTELHGHRGEMNCLRFSPDGALVASSGDDGTVRLWDALGGTPRWHAPLLIGSPPLLLTVGGVVALSRGGAVDQRLAGASWARAVRQRARHAVQWQADANHPPAATAPLCVQTHDQRLQAWDLARDRLLFEDAIAGQRAVAARADGCVALGASEVRIYGLDGAFRSLAVRGSALAVDGDQNLLVAAADAVQIFDRTGKAVAAHRVGSKVTSLLRTGDGQTIAVGFADGNIELLPASSPASAPAAPTLESQPSSPVVRMLEGPPGTLIAGHADGNLALWETATATRLIGRRLHGAVTHLLLQQGRLHAASELGDHTALDLSLFYVDRCALLEQLWRDTPVTWEEGLLAVRPPPVGHPCASR